MWHQPVVIGGITGEASGDLVVDAAHGHLLQSEVHHFQSAVVVAVTVVAEQHFQVHGLGELRRSAGAAVLIVKIGCQSRIGLMQRLHRKWRVTLGHLAGPAHLLGDLRCDPVDLAPIVVI